MHTYSVRIPTKQYLSKFIIAKYGHPDTRIISLNWKNPIGIILLCVLEKKSKLPIKLSSDDMRTRMQSLTAEVVLTAPIGSIYYKGFMLTEDKIIAVNRYFELSFATDLHNYCVRNTKHESRRPGFDKAIYSFADAYNLEIDKDVTFEALKKQEYRFRKRAI